MDFQIGKPRETNVLVYSSTQAEEKSQKCQRCMKCFPTSQQLLQHSLVHSNLRKFPCRYCGKSFKQLSHVQQHLRIHTGERPYRCVIDGCMKAFRQLSSLQQHLKGHSLNTKHLSSYKEELEQKNTNSKITTDFYLPRPHDLTCQICEKQCANDQRFFRHMHKHHPDYWRVFSGGLTLSDFLIAESGSTSKAKPFLCSVCNKRYIHRTGFIKHMSSHFEKQNVAGSLTATNDSECGVCKKMFSKEAYLLRHLEMKTDVKHSAALDYLKNKTFLKRIADKEIRKSLWSDKNYPLVMRFAQEEGCTSNPHAFPRQYESTSFGNSRYGISPEMSPTSYLTFTSCIPSPTYLSPMPAADISRAIESFGFKDNIYYASSKLTTDSCASKSSFITGIETCYQDSVFNSNNLGPPSLGYTETMSPCFPSQVSGYYPLQPSFCSIADTRAVHSNFNASFNSQINYQATSLTQSEILESCISKNSHEMASAFQHFTKLRSLR